MTIARTQERAQVSVPHEDWRNVIRESQHEDEVIQLVRDQMARWSPEEIARLPEDCRPGRVRDAEDISQWAFVLATNHCAATAHEQEHDEKLLDRMLEFVTQAAVRICELRSPAIFEERARMKADG
jgi:hypothetical protein